MLALLLALSAFAHQAPPANVTIQSVVVNRCGVPPLAADAVDPVGPSIPLLHRAARELPTVEVERAPFFVVMPDDPAEMALEPGAERFQMEVELGRAEGGFLVDLGVRRAEDGGAASGVAQRDLFLAEGQLLAVPLPMPEALGCEGRSVLYLAVADNRGGTEAMRERHAVEQADVARHFDGLREAGQRRRARAVLASSPVTEGLLR